MKILFFVLAALSFNPSNLAWGDDINEELGINLVYKNLSSEDIMKLFVSILIATSTVLAYDTNYFQETKPLGTETQSDLEARCQQLAEKRAREIKLNTSESIGQSDCRHIQKVEIKKKKYVVFHYKISTTEKLQKVNYGHGLDILGNAASSEDYGAFEKLNECEKELPKQVKILKNIGNINVAFGTCSSAKKSIPMFRPSILMSLYYSGELKQKLHVSHLGPWSKNNRAQFQKQTLAILKSNNATIAFSNKERTWFYSHTPISLRASRLTTHSGSYAQAICKAQETKTLKVLAPVPNNQYRVFCINDKSYSNLFLIKRSRSQVTARRSYIVPEQGLLTYKECTDYLKSIPRGTTMDLFYEYRGGLCTEDSAMGNTRYNLTLLFY